VQQLPVATPQSTPETATATVPAVAPSATATIEVTSVPTDVIRPENLKQVRLLHQYWLAVATAAGIDPYEMDISAIAASADGRLLAVGGCSKALEADLRSGNVYCNGADPDSPEGVPFLLILDADTETLLQAIPENEPKTTIADLAFTPDGEKLIYAVQPGKVAMWDVPAGQAEVTLWEGEMSAPAITVSPDGKWIALKTIDEVQIWDTAGEEFVAEIPGYFRPQFSRDSQKLLVYHDRKFVIHETDTWAEIQSFGMPCDCVYVVSPNLSLLATSERASAESAPIVIWDTSTGVQVASLQDGEGMTAFLAFSPDGKMLWRAGARGDLTAWDTGEWNFLAENIGGITPIFNLQDFQFVGDSRHYLLVSDQLLGLYGLP
jgi:WD40 repeat protein